MRVLAIQTALAINSGGGRADYEVLSQLARRGHEIEAVMPYACLLYTSDAADE